MIVGPVGSGKSTASAVAAKLLSARGTSATAISSGYIYRIFAYISHVMGIDWEANNSQDLLEEMKHSEIVITAEGGVTVDGDPIEVTYLKAEEISVLTSKIAQVPAVRQLAQAKLNEVISRFEGELVLVDGRDHEASLYGDNPVLMLIYLQVSDTEASRRTGESVEEVIARNERDAERLRAAELKANTILDTTMVSEDRVAERIAAHVTLMLNPR